MKTYTSLNKMWWESISILKRIPPIPCRNGEMREVFGYGATLPSPACNILTHPSRKISRAYASAELVWYLSGSDDLAFIEQFAPSYAKYSDNGTQLYGAYGARLKRNNQLWKIYKMLSDEVNSRRAVAVLYDPFDVRKNSLDIPCTLSLQFLVRDDALHLIVTMRSNDAWLGMPYDVFCFTSIQRLMASALKVSLGSYTHQVGSLHLYERNLEKTSNVTFDVMDGFSLDTPDKGDWNMIERKAKWAKEKINKYINQEPAAYDDIEAFLGKTSILGQCVGQCAKHLGYSVDWLFT